MKRLLLTRKCILKLPAICLALAASVVAAHATANYVYHEQTANDVTGGNPTTCGGAQAYVPVLTPNGGQSYLLRFKVEYQFYTDTIKVYYTTDGSSPSGALGVPSGTTVAATGNYQCTFTSGGNTIDVCNATIPAQPPGTTVKYIISARHSGGGPEIFANSGEFSSPFTTSAQATVFQYTVSIPPIVVVESRTAASGITPNPPYLEGGTGANWASSGTRSSVSAAGLVGVGSRFATLGTPFFTVTPTLTPGVTYLVENTIQAASASANIVVALATTGTSASTLPATTTAFQAVNGNSWVSLGTITPSSATPTVTFTYSSGTLSRFYADAVRFVPVTAAGVKTWNGGGADNFWTTGLNWGGVSPNPGGGDTAAFGGSTRLAPVMDGPFIVNSLAFNSTAAAFTLSASGGGLTVATASGVTNGSATAQIINLPVNQGANRLVMDTSAGNMTFGGIITGSGGYTKLGSGTVIWNNAGNTITGPVSISNGVFEITTSARIGGTGTGAGDVTINGGTFRNDDTAAGIGFLTANRGVIAGPAGGTINLPSGVVQVFSGLISGSGNTLTVNGPGEFRATTNATVLTGGHNTFAKLVVDNAMYTLGTATTGGAEDSLGAVPSITTDDAITLQNGGRLRGNVYSITLDSKRGITLGTGGGIIRNVTGTLTIPSAIKGGNNLTIGGSTDAGVVTLSGNNTYTGDTTITTGIAVTGNNNAFGSAVGATTVNSGAAIQVSGTRNIPEPVTLNGTGIAGAGALRNTANNNTWSGPITLGSSGVRINCDASTLTLSGGISGSGNPNLTIGGLTSVTISTNSLNIGTGTLTWDGATQLRLDTANTMGAFVYNTAIVKFNHNNAAGSGTITVNTPGGSGEFSVIGGFFVTMPNAVVLSAGSNPQMYAASGGSLEMTGQISGSGALRRTDTGAAGPVFSGNNIYSGGYTINSRDVTFGNRLALGVGTFTIGDPLLQMLNLITLKTKPGTSLTGASAITNSITINTNFAIVGPDPIEFAGNVALASTPSILVSNSSAANFSGSISGTGIGINKTGSATLTLSGVNGYNGPTIVTAGTLLVNGSINNSAATVLTGGTLGGNGSVGTLAVNAGGTVAPGTSLGTLTATTVSALNGTNLMEIDRTGAPASDKLNVTSGTVPLGGTLTVKLLGGSLQLGDTFDLFDGTLTGAFTSFNLPVPPAGLAWDTSQVAAGGTGTITLVCSGTLVASAGPDKGICGVGSVAIGGSPTASAGSGAGYTYLWSPSTGLSSATDPNPLASPTITTVYTVTVTDSLGCTAVSGPVTVSVNDNASITADSTATGCQGASAPLAYSATTGSPNQYSIDFDAAAEAAGFTDITLAVLPASPIPVAIPGAVAAGTYNATLTVKNSTTGCVSAGSPFTITVNPSPTITLGANPSVCAGITNAELTYSATSNFPDQYTIDFDTNAETNGFVDVVLAPLTNSPIVLSLPPTVPAGVYYAILTVRNSTNGCSSSNIPIAITNLSPLLACPANLIVSNSPGLCANTNVDLGAPVVCDPIVLTNDAPASFPRGITPVIWTAVASNGISASCTQLVTVLDVEAPFINCGQHETVSCMQGWGFTVPIVTDNCDSGLIPVAISTTTNFTCGYTFEATRVWQVTDSSTNVTYCTQVVTTVDSIPPTITQCASNLTVNCLADVPPVDLSLISADNQFDPCDASIPLITLFSEVTNGSNPTIISRTYRATDACGNPAQCVQTITISPTVLTLACATNKTVECGSVWTFDEPSASGACCGTNIEVSVVGTVTNGSCPQLITRTWQAVCFTNSTTCSQTVTVVDTTAPSLACATNKTVECGSAWTFDPPGASDACSGTNVVVAITGTLTNGTCPQIITRTWSATDLCGNSNTCSQVVTVEDTTPPSFTCATNKTVECGSAWDFDAPGASDDCSGTNVVVNVLGTVTNGSCPQTLTRTWSATDLCGNSNTCNQVVTVVDTTPPFINCGQHETVSCMQGWGFTVPIVTDNCDTGLIPVPISTTTNFTCGYTFEATRVWQVTDSCTNIAYCTQVVTTVDSIPPTITQCASNLTVNCLADVPPVDLSLISADNQFDPCDTSIPLITLFSEVTNGSNPTIISRTYHAADACGNYAQCVQTITIPAPVLMLACSTNKTVDGASAWTFDEPVASGACCGTNIYVSVLDTVTNGTCPQLITRTWQAVCFTNSTTCSQTVTVLPPALVLTCATNKTVPCDACSLAAGPLVFSLVHSLADDGSEGQYPYASLVQDTNGALYGTALRGGSDDGFGTLFKVNPDGSGFTVLHSFNGLDGIYPSSALLLASDGMLYGTASGGGSNDAGTIFKLATDGSAFSILHHFGATADDGQKPLAGLLEGTDTVLYGTTEFGGTSNRGTVFILSKDGSGYSIIHHFGVTAGDGQRPYAALIEGSDHAYYGTASGGGSSNAGTVFTLHGNGSGYAILHNFDGATGGLQPNAALLEASDHRLYGTAYSGGASNGGVIFKLNTNGAAFAVLHDFNASATDGLSPYAGLIESPDGDLLGTTTGGGANNLGTAYSIGKTGLGYNILHDFSSPDGVILIGGLLLASDGALYGAAVGAGAGGLGTVYKLSCASGIFFDAPTASGGAGSILITITGTVTNGDCPKMITRTWQATDSCTNTASCSQTITIIDTIPPVITCPSNIVIFTCTNLVVPFTVGVTDNCTTNVSLVCTPPSGTLFNLGTTNTIHCVATDACGNTNTCDFTIALPRPGPLGNLQINLSGTTVTIGWTSPGILQQADTLFGPWTDVAGTPASPYSFTVTPSTPMRFYRLRCN